MLSELYIENLAVIEKAVITFSEKLNIFSGETGAGKSILIGGINAILGGRVSKDLVRGGSEKAVITALFTSIPEEAVQFLTESGYAPEGDELLLMREITVDGKSAARINGKSTTAAILREAAALLIDIHGQHDTRLLMDKDNQREILDNYGGIKEVLAEYSEYFREFQTVSRMIKKLETEDALKQQKIEILSEKIKDVDSFKFTRGEEDAAVAELKLLQNSEAVERCLNAAYYTITGGDERGGYGLIDGVQRCISELDEVADVVEKCRAPSERLRSIAIELDDIKAELGGLIPSGNDKQRLSALETRVSDIHRIRRKYGMTIDEILYERDKWKRELHELEYSDDVMQKLLGEKRTLGDSVKKLGEKITDLRKKAAERLTEAAAAELNYLNMPDVRFSISVTQDKVTISGMDSVEMLIAVNKGEELKPLSKTASGGELSRIMLALKSVLASNDNIPTMIFDEIDTGISGQAAQKVGIKLKQLSKKRQVLCVTHLAQIAAMADKHLMIEKTNDEKRTYTKVFALNDEGRKRELARIISGDPDSEISNENAVELLNFAKMV